jgi:hypothetical protein
MSSGSKTGAEDPPIIFCLDARLMDLDRLAIPAGGNEKRFVI